MAGQRAHEIPSREGYGERPIISSLSRWSGFQSNAVGSLVFACSRRRDKCGPIKGLDNENEERHLLNDGAWACRTAVPSVVLIHGS
jgi:hypothetical protein